MRASREEQAMTPLTRARIEAIRDAASNETYPDIISCETLVDLCDAAIKGVEPSKQGGAGDGGGEISVQSHLERADAWCRELWAANSLTLHMCDGTVKTGLSGLLRDIRDDVRVLRKLAAGESGMDELQRLGQEFDANHSGDANEKVATPQQEAEPRGLEYGAIAFRNNIADLVRKKRNRGLSEEDVRKAFERILDEQGKRPVLRPAIVGDRNSE